MMALGVLSYAIITSFVLSMFFSIIRVIKNWLLFEKANVAGWKSLIPFYNTYCEVLIGLGTGQEWIFASFIISNILMLFSNQYQVFSIFILISFILAIHIRYSFYRSYAEKGLAILATLIPIFSLIIAFGDYKYRPLSKSGGDMNGY